jgi:hypothetical protein
MSGNGRTPEQTDGRVLYWPGRVLSAADLQRSLNGRREVVLAAHTVLTPLAGEELRHEGITVTRQPVKAQAAGAPTWGYAQDRPHGLVKAAVQGLAREGVLLRELACCDGLLCRWAKALAECVARGECAGGVVFCEDPGLVCCVANKVAGLRAVAVTTVGQAARSTLTLAANLLAVEMPGRTFFEVRQMFRALCALNPAGCPDGVACTLRELDGHAHR